MDQSNFSKKGTIELLLTGLILITTIGLAIYLPASKITLLPALGLWAIWAGILAFVAPHKAKYPRIIDVIRSLFNFWGVGIAFASLLQWSWSWSAYLFLPLLILIVIVEGKFTEFLGFSTPQHKESPTKTGRSLRMAISPYDHPRFRFVNGCEIGMGAPENGDYVMPSGVVFHGGENYAFTPDQRFLLVPATVRTSQCALSIYDSERDVLYRLDGTDANAAIAQAEAGQIDALLADAVIVPLKIIVDLRLPLDWDCAELNCSARYPDGQYELRGGLVLPDSLLAQSNPLAALGLGMSSQSLSYRLSINGVDSGLLCHYRFGDAAEAENYRVQLVQWFMAGKALLIRATNTKNIEGWWLWRAEQGWDLLKLDQSLFPCQGNQSDVRVAIDPWDVLDLNERVLRFKSSWQSAASTPTQRLHHFGRRPDRIEHPDALHRHDERGRIVESPAATNTEIVIEYDFDSQTASIETQGLNGSEARISAIDGEWRQYAAYRYQIGTLILPGAWLLQHRVSSDGRYLALIRHADEPLLPSRIHLFDSQTQRLTEVVTDLIDPALGTFFDEQLVVYHLQGWRAQPFRAHRPLRYFDLPVPTPHQAWDFKHSADREGYLYYRAEQIDAMTGKIARVDYDLFQAPVATAEGDFTYHHASMPLAVHYFGAVNEYQDNRMDARHPFGHGCALIALQQNSVREWIGIPDVAPAMIFSSDGRYLALCYWQQEMNITPEQIKANDGFDLWQLYLLDLEYKTLRTDTKKLGNLPDFQTFNPSGITLNCSDNDWVHDDNETQTLNLKLHDLLKLPAVPLKQVDDLWLLEQEPREDWKINRVRYAIRSAM